MPWCRACQIRPEPECRPHHAAPWPRFPASRYPRLQSSRSPPAGDSAVRHDQGFAQTLIRIFELNILPHHANVDFALRMLQILSIASQGLRSRAGASIRRCSESARPVPRRPAPAALRKYCSRPARKSRNFPARYRTARSWLSDRGPAADRCGTATRPAGFQCSAIPSRCAGSAWFSVLRQWE